MYTWQIPINRTHSRDGGTTGWAAEDVCSADSGGGTPHVIDVFHMRSPLALLCNCVAAHKGGQASASLET